MKPLKNVKIYTIQDIYALPEGKHAELIDGRFYDTVPQGRTHQKISMQLCRTIANYIDRKNGSCEVYAAPFAVFFSGDNRKLFGTGYLCHL